MANDVMEAAETHDLQRLASAIANVEHSLLELRRITGEEALDLKARLHALESRLSALEQQAAAGERRRGRGSRSAEERRERRLAKQSLLAAEGEQAAEPSADEQAAEPTAEPD